MPDSDQDDVARRRKRVGKPSRIMAWTVFFRTLRRDGRAAERRRARLVRLLLLGLSAAAVLFCLPLWANGHGYSALRVLAAGAVLVTGILLLV